VLVGAVDGGVDADLPDHLADRVGAGLQVGRQPVPGPTPPILVRKLPYQPPSGWRRTYVVVCKN
jgi:hypothetical protein